MEVNGDVEVNVSIWATNWQNQMDFASALVNVVPGNAPVLSAGRRVVLEASEELRLEACFFFFWRALAWDKIKDLSYRFWAKLDGFRWF